MAKGRGAAETLEYTSAIIDQTNIFDNRDMIHV